MSILILLTSTYLDLRASQIVYLKNGWEEGEGEWEGAGGGPN